MAGCKCNNTSVQPRNHNEGPNIPVVDVESQDHLAASKPGPDKGIAWVVAIAGFWVLAVLIGITRTSGVLFVHFIHELNVNRDQASWPVATSFLTFCAASPVAAILSKHFSIRSICCCGSVLLGISVYSCYFAKDIIAMTLLIGVLFGIGQSLLFNLSIVAVNRYFQRHRSTANGIQQAGASFGGALLPPTAEFIVEKFNFHGAFIFLGTIAASTLGASILFKKPSWMHDSKPPVKHLGNTKHLDIPKTQNKVTLRSYKRTDGGNLPDSNDKSTHVPSHSADSSTITTPCRKVSMEHTENSELLNADSSGNKTEERKPNPDQIPASEQLKNPENSECPKQEDSGTEESGVRATCKKHLKEIGGVLKLPMFWVSCQSQMVYFFVFNVYNQTIADHSARDRGVTLQEAAYIMSVLSAGDFIGRLSTGWVYKMVSGKNVVFLSAFGMAVVCAITPLALQFATIFTASTFFGITSGLLRAVTVIQFIEYLGMEKFHLAVGISQLTCGLPHLIRPALIGYFRDTVGSYDGLFYLNGGVAFVSACIWLLEPLFTRTSKTKEEVGDKV